MKTPRAIIAVRPHSCDRVGNEQDRVHATVYQGICDSTDGFEGLECPENILQLSSCRIRSDVCAVQKVSRSHVRYSDKNLMPAERTPAVRQRPGCAVLRA
jgi:hypothetical protein